MEPVNSKMYSLLIFLSPESIWFNDISEGDLRDALLEGVGLNIFNNHC
ncbi:MAG: hypothetical protein ACREVX_05945 [Clostridium sp.]